MQIRLIAMLTLISMWSGFAVGWYTPDSSHVEDTPDSSQASDTTETSPCELPKDVDVDYAYDKITALLNFDDIDQLLAQNGYGKSVSMTYLVDLFSRGEYDLLGNTIKKNVTSSIFGEIEINRKLMLSIVVVVIFGSIFTKLSVVGSSMSVGENGFYVTYLVITSIILSAFCTCIELAAYTLNRMILLIRIIIPVFMVAVNFVGHTVLASSAYQLVLIAIWLVQAIMLKLLLPIVKYYVMISLVNNINKEAYFSKLLEVLESFSKSVLKVCVLFVIGMNLVKGLVGPQLDMLGRNTVNRIITSVSGTGVTSILTSTFLASGMVVKNSVGLAAVTLLLIMMTGPLIKLYVIRLLVRLVTVIVEPIAEKRYIEGIDTLNKGIKMLMSIMYASIVMFVLIIAIMAFVSNS